MSSSYKYRVLIVDDDPAWVSFLQNEFGKYPDVELGAATSVSAAKALLAKTRFHYISIDQNMPRAPGEVVLPSVGLDFCEDTLRRYPLTRRGIYTGHGETEFAQRAGALDDTTYAEKAPRSAEREGGKGVKLSDYVSGVVSFLRGRYLHWAFQTAGKVAPPRLATLATQAADALECENWNNFFNIIAELRELGLWISFAITAAFYRGQSELQRVEELCRAPSGKFDISMLEQKLRRAWKGGVGLGGNNGLGDLFFFAGDSNYSNVRLLDSMEALRALRNEYAHREIASYLRRHFTEHFQDLLRLCDLLAALSRIQLMYDVRRHASQPNVIEFMCLRGGYPWRVQNLEHHGVRELDMSETKVWAHWGREDDPVWISAWPYIAVRRSRDGEPRPALLKCLGGGLWETIDLRELRRENDRAPKEEVEGANRFR